MIDDPKLRQDERLKVFITFCLDYKKVINNFIRANQQILNDSLKNVILKVPAVLDFDSKRLLLRSELKRGARPLIQKSKNQSLLDVIIIEILEDKIELAPRDECDTTFLDGGRRTRRASDETPAPGEREIYGSDLKRIKEQRIKELSALLNPTKK